jgi:hypothetical protein
MSRARPALGGGWTLWPHVQIRAAGFPFSLLDETLRSRLPSDALRQVVTNSAFREAVTWQNRAVVARAIDRLLKAEPCVDNGKLRRSRRLVAKYLQRYCAKNDTIGFFGPIGWGTAGGAGTFEPGASLIAERSTFFEPWAIWTLAAAQSEARRLDAPVWLPGHLRLLRATVRGPTRELPLSGAELDVMKLADGRPAAAILAQLSPAPAGRPTWQAVLAKLAAQGLLRWEFPTSVSHDPGAPWRPIGDCEELAVVEALRAGVAAAAGDEGLLDSALAKLEAEFERLTGRSALRNAGQIYAGRGLVYEECRRDVDFDLSRAAIAQVAPALRVTLDMARWYSFQVAAGLAASLLDVFARQKRKRIPLQAFWHLTEPLFAHEVPPAVVAAVERMRKPWAAAWERAEVSGDALHMSVAAAAAVVAEWFQAPCPGWPGARHHAPDLMWSAPDRRAFLEGRGVPVLAELHPGVTPFTTLSSLSLCPAREALAEEWRLDFPDRLVSPIPHEDFARSTLDARLARDHWHLDVGGAYVSDRPPDQVLRAADFDVVASAGGLIAVHVGNKLELDLIALFERRIKLKAAVAFSLLEDTDTGGRRFIGPVMIQRAFRRLAAPRTQSPYGAAACAEIKTWRLRLGLPDRVFVRVPTEVEPIYVDFTSDISIDLFQSVVRQAASVTIAEMYPAPGGLWFCDAEDRRFVSELRLIAVDPKAHDPRAVWAAAARRTTSRPRKSFTSRNARPKRARLALS